MRGSYGEVPSGSHEVGPVRSAVVPRLLLCNLLIAILPFHASAQRDGRRDFDFEIGAWKARLSRLEHPLSGSTKWLDYEGTSVVRAQWE